MRVVTSGKPYIDIDAYGGIIAHAELLRAQGHDAIAASSAVLNESISQSVRTWPAQLYREAPFPHDTQFSLIDTSDPAQFDSFVVIDSVLEVIDHHVGYESYWQNRIGDGATIEFIGAACTLVYERWLAANLLPSMSQTSARLLICGILDNTLNFNSDMTTPRDLAAYNSLVSIAELALNWPEIYFSECQVGIEKDIYNAIRNDTKEVDFGLSIGPIAFGQLALWSGNLLESPEVKTLLSSIPQPEDNKCLLNLLCIGEKQSQFITNDPTLQAWLSDLIGVAFRDNTATADRLWLRKEIIKKNLECLSRRSQ